MADTSTGPLRDIGSLNNIEEPEILVDLTRKGQVYQATHDGTGNRLSLHDRSFISFSFGGKHIEDFDLIAVVSGDRMERQGYSNFEDTVSTYPNLDGQQYWSTHSQAHEFTFNLATDGIEQKTLDDFLNWFAPGCTRELILAEHPNRWILARVSQPPQLSLLPFEYDTTIKIKATKSPDTNTAVGEITNDYSSTFAIKTALYKGEIELTLIADEPYWYGITNAIVLSAGETLTFDLRKLIYEDHIPYQTALNPDTHMFFGDGYYGEKEFTRDGGLTQLLAAGYSTGDYSQIPDRAYLYYAGTAPAHVNIKFGLRPYLNTLYVTVPWNPNSIKLNSNVPEPYNTFTIGGYKKYQLCLTTPNVYTSYNKAIELFDEGQRNAWEWTKYEQLLRDSVRHPYVRAWALKIIDVYRQSAGGNSVRPQQGNKVDIPDDMKHCMMYFLAEIPSDTSSAAPPKKKKLTIPIASFEFDSETGKAIGKFRYRIFVPDSEPTATMTSWYHYGNIETVHTEDVGDMLRSNLLILREQNRPDSNGVIQPYNAYYPYLSHYVQHNMATALPTAYDASEQTNTEQSEGIYGLTITYKHMYL